MPEDGDGKRRCVLLASLPSPSLRIHRPCLLPSTQSSDSAGTGRISVAELRNILFRIGYSPLQQEMENIDDIVRVGRGYIYISI